MQIKASELKIGFYLTHLKLHVRNSVSMVFTLSLSLGNSAKPVHAHAYSLVTIERPASRLGRRLNALDLSEFKFYRSTYAPKTP